MRPFSRNGNLSSALRWTRAALVLTYVSALSSDASADRRFPRTLLTSSLIKGPTVAGAFVGDTLPSTKAGAPVQVLAELLYWAAEPLSHASGSTPALLPYLTPGVLRLYLSQPSRCSPALAEEVHDLAHQLYGTWTDTAPRYTLYRALRSTFAWVAQHAPLRVQHLPQLPTHDATWPDVDDPADLVAALGAALIDETQLGGVGRELEAATQGRLSGQALAALVPRISGALAELHRGLADLWEVAEAVYSAQWKLRTEAVMAQPQAAAAAAAVAPAAARLAAAGRAAESRARRRQLRAVPPNFRYAMPPGFTPAPPGQLPQLLVPLVFHVLSAMSEPAGVSSSPGYVDRWVRLVNIMAKPTNFQFSVQEVRWDPAVHAYLQAASDDEWRECYTGGSLRNKCWRDDGLVTSNVVDFPRAINVFVGGLTIYNNGISGTAFAPGNDKYTEYGTVYMAWDTLDAGPGGRNNLESYNEGAAMLLHELFHHLGLQHTFGTQPDDVRYNTCSDDDGVADTPSAFGSVGTSEFLRVAVTYCSESFWGRYRGEWNAVYDRWSTQLGIPEEDMNAWADSCPTLAGYDELGNYMTYSPPVCIAALGHFTAGQVQAAHYVTAEWNPVLYAWGQYYALNAPPPPPMASPPPEVSPKTHCQMTTNMACRCKANWTSDGQEHSYCARLSSGSRLYCEVDAPSTCADCSDFNPCILSCEGNVWMCGLADAPPPPPRTGYNLAGSPPPPPIALHPDCMVAANGCPCRSSWKENPFSSDVMRCCAPLPFEEGLWCEVAMDCPHIVDYKRPIFPCEPNLTPDHCRGAMVAGNPPAVAPPPSPDPAAPPSPEPRPPSYSRPSPSYSAPSYPAYPPSYPGPPSFSAPSYPATPPSYRTA